MRFHYRALGLDIVAPFACPGFWPVEDATTGRAVTLDLGPVPTHLADPVRDRPLLQIAADGTALHHVPGVARYLVEKRARVTIALEPGATLGRALDFLDGTPLALLCHQWGLVPLDAACVAREGRALLLGAGVGCGKTTLALALAAHGFTLMSDGPCALEAKAGAAPVIWPAFPRVKAWRDSLMALERALPGEPGPGGRYTLPADTWFEPKPRPAMAVVAFHQAKGGIAERVARRRGASAFETVMNMQSLADAMRGLAPPGAAPAHAIARLASLAPVHEAWVPNGLDRLGALPGWLLDRLALGDGAATRGERRVMRVTDYLVVAEAMVTLTLARLATWLPFRWMMADEAPSADAVLDIGRRPADPRALAVARLLARADRRLPWKTTCLVEALAGRAMLRRRGIACVLRFGLRRDAEGRLGAHAWLEAGGGVVCGGPAAKGFVHLAGFSRTRRP